MNGLDRDMELPQPPDEPKSEATFAAPQCYETAIFQLTFAADDRDKTAAKLRDWADEEHPGQKRTEQLNAVLDNLREANELRAAAEVLKSHNKLRHGATTQNL